MTFYDLLSSAVFILVMGGIAVLALVAARKSRKMAEEYRSSNADERAVLDEKMRRNPLLDAAMKPLGVWALAGAIFVFVLVVTFG